MVKLERSTTLVNLGLVGLAALLLIGLPLAGAWLAGAPLGPLLELPPRPVGASAPGFAWPAFAILSVLIVAAIAPFAWRLARKRATVASSRGRAFPAWGWLALAWTASMWLLAWTRFPWFEAFQQHTFAPLWIGYIAVVNALTVHRQGAASMTGDPGRFALLFPLSALFWWFFEFLNRFAGNWYYVGIGDFGPLEYTFFATLSFSTVLPAVASTAEYLRTFPRIDAAFASWIPVRPPSRALAIVVLALAAVSLAGLGPHREVLYPLVWISPLVMLVGLQLLAGRPTLLEPLSRGDWRHAVSFSMAALVCGFFWEMWNFGSLARWAYAIPYVGAFRVFEMPLLGYAGYLPFGLECAAIATLVTPSARPGRSRPRNPRTPEPSR